MRSNDEIPQNNENFVQNNQQTNARDPIIASILEGRTPQPYSHNHARDRGRQEIQGLLRTLLLSMIDNLRTEATQQNNVYTNNPEQNGRANIRINPSLIFILANMEILLEQGQQLFTRNQQPNQAGTNPNLFFGTREPDFTAYLRRNVNNNPDGDDDSDEELYSGNCSAPAA